MSLGALGPGDPDARMRTAGPGMEAEQREGIVMTSLQ
jgi:hypothetical protein